MTIALPIIDNNNSNNNNNINIMVKTFNFVFQDPKAAHLKYP